MLSDLELQGLRAKEKRDRIVFKRILIGLPILFIVVIAFVLLDIVGTPALRARVRIAALHDNWTLKHGQRCQIDIETPYGGTYVWRSGLCARSPWHLEDSVDVELHRGRLTRFLFVYGEPFAKRRSMKVFGLK